MRWGVWGDGNVSGLKCEKFCRCETCACMRMCVSECIHATVTLNKARTLNYLYKTGYSSCMFMMS